MDLKLPDNVLCEVFAHSSLSDKFKLAAVDQQFRRCMAWALSKPQPLVLEMPTDPFTTNRILHKKLNGYTIDQLPKWPRAVQVLAQKTQFSRFEVRDDLCHNNLLDAILTILCNADCLSELTEFVFHSGQGTQTLIQRFLGMCPKLSSLQVPNLLAPNIPIPLPCLSLNLAPALKNKPLAEVTLGFTMYEQKDLLDLFKSIKPNVLQKLDLTFRHVTLDMAQLINKLGGGPWAALREIRLTSGLENTFDHMEELFAIFPILSQLQRCCVDLVGSLVEVPLDQMVVIAASLLSHADRSNPLEIKYLNNSLTSGCQVIKFVRQTRKVHRRLQVQFGTELYYCDDIERVIMTMSLVLGNITFVTHVSGEDPCADAHCIHCHSYYPIVLSELVERAKRQEEDVHLVGYVMDRCGIESMVEHINRWGRMGEGMRSKALRAILNEDRDKVVVTFEARGGSQYKITVDCGPCFNIACVQCKDV